MTIKSAIKDFLPPILIRALRRILHPTHAIYGFVGEYSSFESALAASTGYETSAYANPTADRLRALLSEPPSRKIDERFQQVHSALSLIAQTENTRQLSVLDVGGGNGTYALAMKRLLPNITLDWTVLETRPVVEACKNIRGAPCTFTDDTGAEKFDVALISGTLQYLPRPIDALLDFAKRARWIILTRVPVIEAAVDKITLQVVPPHLYTASMPVWLFSAPKLEVTICEFGTVMAEWDVSPDSELCAMAGARSAGYLARTRS